MKQILNIFALSFLSISILSCVGDDIINDRIAEELKITNTIDTIGFEATYLFESRYLDNVGQSQDVEVEWSSSDEEVISINNDGWAEGIGSGSAIITVEYQGIDEYLIDEIVVVVGENTTVVENENTVKEGSIMASSFYVLEGSFSVQEIDGDLVVEIGEDYQASTALPGLYVYLSNNPSSVGGAHEIAAVSTFNGAHSYTIPNVGIDDYKFLLYFCKPFNVKVGDGAF